MQSVLDGGVSSCVCLTEPPFPGQAGEAEVALSGGRGCSVKLPSSEVPRTRRTWTCTVGPEEDRENNERAGTPSCENRLRELGLFSPE